MAGKSVRWVCPNGLHPGVNGPTRPRKDNIVRYCFPCSLTAGKLVERTAPALEKKREVQKEKTQAKAQTRAQRAKEKARRQTHIPVREVDGSEGMVDVRKTIRRMMKLTIIKEYADKYYRWPPEVTVRYSQHKPYSSGHAWTGGDITITVGRNESREAVEELLLHELVHVITPSKAHHGPVFRRVFALAAREWWPGIRVRADHPGHIYYLGEAVINEAIRIKKENA